MEEYYAVETKYQDDTFWFRRDNKFSTIEALRQSEYLKKIVKTYSCWRIIKVSVLVEETHE